ncbi:hypothetical protein TNCV_5054421 [Trichonephila clavipes]|nr:hypothetical protein TNCV_5054421 [Trichonephila clavipes]
MGRNRSNRHGKVKWLALKKNLLRWFFDQRIVGRSNSTASPSEVHGRRDADNGFPGKNILGLPLHAS